MLVQDGGWLRKAERKDGPHRIISNSFRRPQSLNPLPPHPPDELFLPLLPPPPLSLNRRRNNRNNSQERRKVLRNLYRLCQGWEMELVDYKLFSLLNELLLRRLKREGVMIRVRMDRDRILDWVRWSLRDLFVVLMDGRTMHS